MAVTGFQDFNLADADREWDGDAADKRVRKWAGAEDEPNQKYRDAHVWYDADNKDNFTAYKLLICDVVKDKLVAVPRAVMAAGGIMQGARGGVDIPKSDVDRVKSHLAKYCDQVEDAARGIDSKHETDTRDLPGLFFLLQHGSVSRGKSGRPCGLGNARYRTHHLVCLKPSGKRPPVRCES